MRLHAQKLRRRLRRVFDGNRTKPRDRAEEVGIEEPASWRRGKRVLAVRVTAALGTLLLLAWVLRAGYVVFFHKKPLNFPVNFNPDSACAPIGPSCGAVTGFVLPWLSLAFATALFLVHRLKAAPRERQKTAESQPHKLVPTAGSITGRIVGRDELCKVLIDNVWMEEDRRPQLIMGGVGTGKTAVIVHLTQLLARYHAVPVSIRLRDVDRGFTFHEQAFRQFQSQIDKRLYSGAEGEKIWRYLRREDRVVVLADGLEEALCQDKDRDDHIRLAIAGARKDRLPLVIASRPHNTLRGMDASILELEPVSEEAALQYLGGRDAQDDRRRVDWIVETAGVTEAPLYLRMAHELNKAGMLSHLARDDDDPTRSVNTRSLDRSALRRNLLDTWTSAVRRGRLRGQLPLTPAQRAATITLLSALAAVGLQRDQLEVRYVDAMVGADARGRPNSILDWVRGAEGTPGVVARQADGWTDRFRVPCLTRWVDDELARLSKGSDLRGDVNTRLAAAWGTQLGLVEVRGDAVRFQHSVLQAYLGSAPLQALLADDVFIDEAFSGTERPGREFLIALVLLSRQGAGQRPRAGANGSAFARFENPRAPAMVRLLERKAAARPDSKSLDILAAALEIDSVAPEGHRRQEALAEVAARRWREFRATDLRTLEEAKLGFVHRLGEALREVDRRAKEAHPEDAGAPERQAVERAYDHLFEIGHEEGGSYPVRHAVAQELGVGGLTAYRGLRHRFEDAFTCLDDESWQQDEERWFKIVMSAWLAPLLVGATPRKPGGGAPGMADGATPTENLRCWIGWVGRPEIRARRVFPSYTERRLEVVGRGAVHGAGDDDGGPAAPDDGTSDTQEGATAARTAGERATATPVTGGGAASGNEPPQPRWQHVVPMLPISIEIALAQGFKYAANRRARHPQVRPESRTHLAEQAVELLKRSGFWFSQLTLLQALGLWALPDGSVDRDACGAGVSARGLSPAEIQARVRHWVDIAGSLRDEGREPRGQGSVPGTHRFVVEAGELVIKALVTGRPERYMWIDEHGVTSTIGSSATNRAELRKHQLWIPPSIGWSALDPRAQRLVADVLLLMNLADRGDDAGSRENRLSRANRRDLPPCLTKDRVHLDPNRDIDVAGGSEPGTNCPGDCDFDLCPYPPKGSVSYHAELTETFCRRQQTLLRHRLRGKGAPWQETLPSELRTFWGEMSKRARR